MEGVKMFKSSRKILLLVGICIGAVVGLSLGLVFIFSPRPSLSPSPDRQLPTMIGADADLFLFVDLGPELDQLPGIERFPLKAREVGSQMAFSVTGVAEKHFHFILVIATKDARTTKLMLHEWWGQLQATGDVDITETSYRGVNITVIESWPYELEENTVAGLLSHLLNLYLNNKEYYALIGRYLLVSSDLNTLHQTIDLIKDGGPSLQESQDFQLAQEVLPRDYNIMFYGREMDKLVDRWLGGLGFLVPDSLAGGISILDSGMVIHLDVGLPKLGSVQGASLEEVAALIPKDPTYFLLGRNLKTWWQYTRAKALERWGWEFAEALAALEFKRGFSLDRNVADWMENDFALVTLTAPPDLLLFFEIPSRRSVAQHLDTVFSGLQAAGKVTIDKTIIEGVQATLIKDARGERFSPGYLAVERFSPGYLFLGNEYLVIGSTVGALKEAVLVYEGRSASLQEWSWYEEILSTLPQERRWTVYLNYSAFPTVDESLEAFLQWLATDL